MSFALAKHSGGSAKRYPSTPNPNEKLDKHAELVSPERSYLFSNLKFSLACTLDICTVAVLFLGHDFSSG